MKIARYLSLLGLFIIPSLASATIHNKITIGDFIYNLDDSNQTATVRGVNTSLDDVVNPTIPATVVFQPAGKEEMTFTVVTIQDFDYDASKLKGNLIIPEGVVTIKGSAFEKCTLLTGTLTIPGSVQTIGTSAFKGCTGIETLVITDGVATIDDYAFDGCTKLAGTLTIPESVTTIGKYAFRKTGFEGELVIPGTVAKISDSAFESCTGLTSLSVSGGVTAIGTKAFYGCKGLETVDFGNTLETIGSQAFQQLTKLSGDLTFPDSVKEIGVSAFSGCSGLNGTLTLGTGLETLGTSAFSGCKFTGDLSLPDALTVIPNAAFYNCKFDGSLTLPANLITIGNTAFQNNSFVGELTLPETLQTIGTSAFAGNKGFTGDLTIPNSVTSIAESAFLNLTGLTGTLTVGENVANIGKSAFYACGATVLKLLAQENTSYVAGAFDATNFTDIYLSAVEPLNIAEGTFSEADYENAILHVPGRGAEAYNASATWSAFKNIDAMPILVEGISINQGATTIKIGSTFDLTATIAPADATDKQVIWESSDTSVVELLSDAAAVAEEGDEVPDGKVTVKGAALGKATVTAKSAADETIVATVEITVDPILPESVTIEPKELAVLLGAMDTLTATVYPADTTNPAYTWTSSNDKIVTVDEDGNYEAVGEGEAEIIVTCAEKDEEGNEVSATIKVKVAPVPATGVAVNPVEATLIIGEDLDLTAVIEPAHTTHPAVTWTSSDEKIATVDENGHVVAVADGEVTITATWTDTTDATNTLTGESKITVNPVAAESVVVTPGETELYIGRPQTLSAAIEPSNVTYPALVWTSSDETVATVTVGEDGTVTINGLKEGDVEISATWTDTLNKENTVAGKCEVKVIPVVAEKIELGREEVVLIFGEDGKDTFKFAPVVTPEDTTDATITWASSDDSIVAVAEDGTISAVAVGGPVTITASCGDATAECKVTVQPVLASSVTLNNTELTLFVGQTSKLEPTVAPANTTDKTVVYESDNSGVATVGEDGTVTAVSVGTATITASCGLVSATCEVTVNPVLATGVVLSETSKEMLVEETLTLTATIEPANTTDKTLVWTSSDENVATVANGVVTAVAPGKAVITAACGDVEGTCEVTVNPILASAVVLSETEKEVYVEDTFTLTATIDPANTTDKTLVWTSSDEKVATVSEEGEVTAIAPGKVVITATCGAVKGSCYVTVKPILVTSISFNVTETSIKIGETTTISATVSPDNATDTTLIWTSSDETVATVENGVVTGVAVGSAIITAANGDVTATCNVEVMPVPASSVSLNASSMTLTIGKTGTLTAVVGPANTTDKTIVWSTNDENVATVADGVVTAVGLGNAQIVATCGDVQSVCEVTVEPVEATGIILNVTETALFIDEQLTLTAVVEPDDTTDKTLVWTSSDENVVTVEDGVLTGIAEGDAVITVACGDITATCEVTVKPVPVSVIEFDVDEISLALGTTTAIMATVGPDNATDKTLTWTSSDETVATVSEEGVVTAVALGTATITATSGDVSATCVVTVEPVMASAVVLSETAKELTIGDTFTLTATVDPENTTDKTLVWTSSDEEVATVVDGVVTAVAEGTATITVACGDATATCVVTVEPVMASAVVLDETAMELSIGDTFTLTATVEPENTTDKTLVWTSSDEEVATVVDGVVTAVAEGTATITVTCGDASATCEVTVKAVPATSITLNMTEATLDNIGDTVTLTATVGPANATDKTVVWTSSDEKVATVSEEGVVTAIAEGTATITATCGEVSATCKIKSLDRSSVESIGDSNPANWIKVKNGGVEICFNNPEATEIFVIDLDGKIISRKSVNGGVDYIESVDSNTYVPGEYIVRVTSSGKTATKKFGVR